MQPVTQISDLAQPGVNQFNEPGPYSSDRPSYPFSKAAEMTGVSRSTIKRKHAAGDFPNAIQDEHGHWHVSVGDLLAAGLHLNRMTQTTDKAQKPVTQLSEPGQIKLTQVSGPGSTPADRVAELERELAAERAATVLERTRREAAERMAAEIEKRADLAERALLMLTAGDPPAHQPATTSTERPQMAAEPAAEVAVVEVQPVPPPTAKPSRWQRMKSAFTG